MSDAADLVFARERRTATLATIDPHGRPRLVPICFVLDAPARAGDAALLFSPLDEKPKRSRDVRRLARVRDIEARPDVTLLFERWSEDWSELAWVRAAGHATLVEIDDDPELHARVVGALRAKYPQYRFQALDRAPLLRVTLETVTSWRPGA